MEEDRLSKDDFLYLAAWLSRRTGLVLTIQRTDFAEIRLRPVLKRFGFKTFSALILELHHNSEALAQSVCEAMTVNDSAFFRDPATFAELRDVVLPRLIAKRLYEKRLRIWCAACAAGQEAYSVAMMLDDMELVAAGWNIELIATDLSAEMIARAKAGLYSQEDVSRGLPKRRIVECLFADGDQWRVRQHLRHMVTFRPYNLLDSLGWLWPMDLVLCRNVLMYFDEGTRAAILEKIVDVLASDGSLLVGAGETIAPPAGLRARTSRVSGLYQRTSSARRRVSATG